MEQRKALDRTIQNLQKSKDENFRIRKVFSQQTSTIFVILFSSARSQLETIQRLGRCLRVDRGKPEKGATVVDFVLADEDDIPDPNGVDFERWQWFQRLSKIRPDP